MSRRRRLPPEAAEWSGEEPAALIHIGRRADDDGGVLPSGLAGEMASSCRRLTVFRGLPSARLHS